MARGDIFVGRQKELEEFARVLEEPRGQAVIVVGNRGMGKTWLVNRMARLASEHPTLKCGWVRYEVTPTDSPDSTMALMIDNAFEAANAEPGSFDNVPERKRQWLALFKTFVPRGEQLAELVMSLRRDPAKDTRQQFLERLELISKRMPKEGRAILIVDPEKYMAKESEQTWAIVIKSLPEKIKFIFAQRTEDVLVGSGVIDRLDNLVKIPSDTLETLSEEEVDELVNCRRTNLKVAISDLRKILNRYKGHPYAIGAALDLVEEGTKLEELPKTGKPTEFAAKQWEKIGEKGDDAIKIFEAYAALEVAVPDDVVECVSGIEAPTRKRLQNDKYLRGLLREEAGGRRIYHSILAEYILGQMSKGEKKKYHKRAVEIYRGKLKKAKEEQTKPDELAAVRLAEHVLATEGEEAFVKTCAYETWIPLRILGLLDNAIDLAKRALNMSRKGSEEEAAIRCTIGLAYWIRDDLDNAEKMHLMALAIEQKGQRVKGIAREYGNLGIVYTLRDDLQRAEEMLKKALEIEEKVGSLIGMANAYGNLGNIYFKRGELGKAEQMHKNSLEIEIKLGRLDGMAKDYGNLGNIYFNRGELNKAEQMLNKGLEIDKKLGRLEGMAAKFHNLGAIYKQRGDYKSAREYWEKAHDLVKRIGITNKEKELEGLIESIKDK